MSLTGLLRTWQFDVVFVEGKYTIENHVNRINVSPNSTKLTINQSRIVKMTGVPIDISHNVSASLMRFIQRRNQLGVNCRWVQKTLRTCLEWFVEFTAMICIYMVCDCVNQEKNTILNCINFRARVYCEDWYRFIDSDLLRQILVAAGISKENYAGHELCENSDHMIIFYFRHSIWFICDFIKYNGFVRWMIFLCGRHIEIAFRWECSDLDLGVDDWMVLIDDWRLWNFIEIGYS